MTHASDPPRVTLPVPVPSKLKGPLQPGEIENLHGMLEVWHHVCYSPYAKLTSPLWLHSIFQVLQKEELKVLLNSHGAADSGPRARTKKGKYFCHPSKPQLIRFQLDLIQAFLSLPTADQLSQETVNNIIAQVSDPHQSQLPSQVLILNQCKARKMCRGYP